MAGKSVLFKQLRSRKNKFIIISSSSIIIIVIIIIVIIIILLLQNSKMQLCSFMCCRRIDKNNFNINLIINKQA